MKAIQKRYDRLLALLLSLMLFFGQSGVSVFAEGVSTPTDLQPAATETVEPADTGETESTPSGNPENPAGNNEENGQTDQTEKNKDTETEESGDNDEPASYQQTETIHDIRFTVTAKPGVLPEGESLSIVSLPDDADFREDALAALDVQPSDALIISHAFWSFNVPEADGSVSVRMGGLGLSRLMEENPEGELSVFLLRRNPEGSTPKERAVRHTVSAHPEQDYLTFDLKESALVDLVTILKLPEPVPEENPESADETESGPDPAAEPEPGPEPEPESEPEEAPATQTDLDAGTGIQETEEQQVRSFTGSAKSRGSALLGAPAGDSVVPDNAGEEESPVLRGALSPVTYWNSKDRKEVTAASYNEVTADTRNWNAYGEGEGVYVVSGSVTISGRVSVATSSSVSLILTEGSSLSVPAGICVPSGSTLFIYGQTQTGGTGRLIINNVDSGNAGIGGNMGSLGGSVTVHGGVLTVTGGAGAAAIGAGKGASSVRITVYGGSITAQGGSDAAALGGGSGGSGGDITIAGGIVKATGGSNGAGIGGGRSGALEELSITGGTITAAGGPAGAGIGSGAYYSGDYSGTSKEYCIEITGGTVTATGDTGGAGIGGGISSKGGYIRIRGGTVKATGNGGCGIGPGSGATDASVGLQWLDSTKDGWSVTSNSYGGTVNGVSGRISLFSDFMDRDSGKTFFTGESFAASKLENTVLLPYAQTIDSWSAIQAAINNAYDNEEYVIKLTQNITALSGNTHLDIPSKKIIVVDLNGFTLNRGLEECKAAGEVFYVNTGAKLTIRDSGGSGVITGGYPDTPGGAVCCYGTLVMEGGTIRNNLSLFDGGGVYLQGAQASMTMGGGSITGNQAGSQSGGSYYQGSGGGVAVSGGATFTMNGGSITNNASTSDGGGIAANGSTVNLNGAEITGNWARIGYGGGVYMYGSKLTLQQYAVIRNNNNDQYNLCVFADTSFRIVGSLTPKTDIGINYGYVYSNYYKIVPISDPLENPADVRYFKSDLSYFAVATNSSKQLVMGLGAKVTFLPGIGTGSMPDERTVNNNPYILPECRFTSPDGYNFAGWLVNDVQELKQPGDTITINGNTTLTAAFGIPYEDENGEEKSAYFYKAFSGMNSLEKHNWKNCCIVLDSSQTVSGRVGVTGAVTLILMDGCTLEITAGIDVEVGASLTVYAQHNQTGKLDSRSDSSAFYAGIGGGDGTAFGTVNICGGVIYAQGSSRSAGIGGAYPGKGGTVNIHRGTVTAKGGLYAPGIGVTNPDGQNNCTIHISGGTVTATGGTNGGAGIGGGASVPGGTVTISGGTVTATGGAGGGAGIGGGAGVDPSPLDTSFAGAGSGGTITITGGNVTASGTDGGAGIGGGGSPSATSEYGGSGRIEISGGVVSVSGGIGRGNNSSNTDGTTILRWTDASRYSMKVTSDTYSRQPEFRSSFQDQEGKLYIPGDSDVGSNKTLTPVNVAYDWKSLRSCVAEAASGDTIRVYKDITAEDDDKVITIPRGKTLTIELDGHFLDRNRNGKAGNPDGGIFKNYGSLTLIGSDTGYATVKNGSVDLKGGAIYNEGTLICENVYFRENAVTDKTKGYGGAIYNAKGAAAELRNCDIFSNTATIGGGAISNAGTLILNNCEVLNNEATDEWAFGGGIYTAGENSQLTVQGGCVWGNTCGRYGGGIYTTSRTSITGCDIKNNRANKGVGGGIHALGSVLTVDSSTFWGNSAVNGGAIYIERQTRLTVKGTTRIESNDIERLSAEDIQAGEKAPDIPIAGIAVGTDNCVLTFEGSPYVKDNKASSNQANVLVPRYWQIAADSANPLSANAEIYITTEQAPSESSPVVFTSRLFREEDIACFHSDNPDYIVGSTGDGCAYLGYALTVKYTIGQNVGTKADETAIRGEKFVLEPCTEFDDTVAGIRFSGWLVNGDTKKIYRSGDTVNATGSTLNLTAVFSVPYVDVSGKQLWKDCTILSSSDYSLGNGSRYGRAVVGTVSTNNRLSPDASCIADLILCDGCRLDITGGIDVTSDRGLRIWGQENQTGALNVLKTYGGNAGIGTSSGSGPYTRRVAMLTINGGIITVRNVGEGAAGIGSGNNGSGIIITINGGTVTSTGGRYGAGIGGGNDCSGGSITINGGRITANGGQYYGAGIGGGQNGAGGTITISGGEITAIADNTGSAGIGGGRQGNAGIITISGGTIHARSKDGGAGIGGGWNGSGGSITISGGETRAESNGSCAGIGAGQKGSIDSLKLTWTEQSMESMKVYSTKYTGSVILQKAFWDPVKEPTKSYQPGTLTYSTTPNISDLNGLTLVPCDTFYIDRWTQVQALIDNAGTVKTTIVLSDNITAESFNTRLLVAAGQDITLDLNGYTLDRNSDISEENGYVCAVESGAVLTIQDSRSGGTIKGGKGSSVGAILVDGTLNLQGGTISGNESGGDGGAIVLRDHAKMTMTGGAISGNTARSSAGAIRSYAGSTADLLGGSITGNTAKNYHGGALYIGGTVTLGNIEITGNHSGFQGGAILQGGILNIQGSPVIKDNEGVSGNDVYLRPGKVITVTGELTENALIGVYTEKDPLSAPVVLTSGLAGKGTEDNFKYSGKGQEINPYIVVTLNGEGEAVLGEKADVTVTLDPGAGRGELQNITLVPGLQYTLQTPDYEAPNDDLAFCGWKIRNADGQLVGDLLTVPFTLTINEDTVFVAQYGTAPYDLWVNGIQVTSANKKDILGDGTAAYDPKTKTLTLAGAEIVQVDNASIKNAGIYAKEDLAVTGTFTVTGGKYGVYSGGNLTLTNVTATLTGLTVAGIYASDSLAFTDCAITSSAGASYNLYAVNTIGIHSSDISASGTSGTPLVARNGDLIIDGETTRVYVNQTVPTPSKKIISSGSNAAIKIEAPLSIVLPENAQHKTTYIWDSLDRNPSEILIAENIPLENISIEPAKHNMTNKDAPYQLQLVTVPANATNRDVVWKSSAPTVVSVDENGLITALDTGKATITATAQIGPLDTVSATSEITVIKSAASYNISVAGPFDHGTVACDRTSAKEAEMVGLTITPEEGYHLSRLYYKTEGGREGDLNVNASSFPMVTYNITLYAEFALNTYTVCFDPNGGDGTMENQDFTWGTAAKLTSNAFTLNGSRDTFAGWNTSADGTGTAYADQASVSNLTAEHQGTVFLYAQWAVSKYNLTVSVNDAAAGTVIVSPPETSLVEGAEVHITPEANEGWHLDSVTSADVAIGESNSFTMPAKDVAVTVIFAPNTYSVRFLPGADDVTGAMADQPFTYGTEPAALTANGFNRTGYAFAGWQLESAGEAGSRTFTDQEPVQNLTSVNGGTVTLVARWTVQQYTVIFNANGGTFPADTGTPPATIRQPYNYGDKIVLPDEPSLEGYTFSGWGDVPAAMPAENLEFNAQWTINKYTLTFDANGGTFTGGSSRITSQVEYGGAVSAPSSDPVWSNEDFTFAGWNITVPETMPAKDLLIKAVWKPAPAKYTITFDTVGGSSVAPIIVEENTSVSKPADPTKSGYTFAGWNPDLWSDGAYTMEAKNQTLQAKWTANNYTLIFKDGENQIASITQAFGTAIIPPAAPVRTGYTFAGWDPALPEKMPLDGGAYNALWTVNEYTLTFDANGGTFRTPARDTVITSRIPFLAAVIAPDESHLEKTGYTFAGWSPDLPGTMPAEDCVFKARWTPVDYTVSIDPSAHGSIFVLPDAGSYHYGDTVTVYPSPDRGYLPDTITCTPDGGTEVTVEQDASGAYTFTMPAANVTLTASFAPIPVTGVSLDKTEAEMEAGSTLTLHATLEPADAGDKSVAWESSDPSVAAVDANGKVTALAEGTCTITVTTNSGDHTASCVLTVIPAPPVLYSVTVKDALNGRVIADKTGIPEGTSVTLTAIPEEGYYLETLSLSYSGLTEVVKPGEDGIHTFAMPASDVIVKPVFAPHIYTITFNTAGGSPVDSITQAYGTAVTAPADPEKEGYRFIGWNDAVPATMPARNMSLVARWTAESYTISFHTDGGSHVPDITQEYGSLITPPADPEKAGYTFRGWEPALPSSMPAKDMELTAIWKVNQYTITFRSFGGLVGTITRNYGEAVDPPADPEATGYEFAGWDPALPAVMPAEDLTVRAQWIPVDYFVIPLCDPAAGYIATDQYEAHYGDTVTITVTPYAGYTLDTLIVYTDGDPILPTKTAGVYTFTMPAAHVVIYASFTVDEDTYFRITVTTDSHGTVIPDHKKANLQQPIQVSVLPDAGYALKTLQYSYSDPQQSGTSVTQELVPDAAGQYLFTMPASDVTISATFETAIYHVATATDLNGTVDAVPADAAMGTDISITASPNPGYRLWSLTWTPESGDVRTVDITAEGPYTISMPAADITVRAAFDSIPVTGVTVDPASGSLRIGETETLQLNAEIQPANALDHRVIWTSSNPSVAAVDENGLVTAVGAGEVTITATTEDGGYRGSCAVVVCPEKVTVSFSRGDTSGVSGDMPSVTVNKGDVFTLPDHEFILTPGSRIRFLGWSWADGSGTPGTPVTVNSSMEFTAVWGFPVTVDDMIHGTAEPSPAGGSAGTDIALAVQPDEGYKLKTGSLQVIPDGSAEQPELTGSGNAWTFTMPAGPVTVTAEFEPVSYTVRFLPNHPEASADETMEDQTHLFDDIFDLPECVFTYTGRAFAGWNTEAEGTGAAYRDLQTVAGLSAEDGAVVTLYAQWTMPDYPIEIRSENGWIALSSGRNSAKYQENVRLDVSPDRGYSLYAIVVSGPGLFDLDIITGPDDDGVWSFTMPDYEVTLYALFTANAYTVVFDPDTPDVTGEMEDQVFYYGDEQELSPNAYKRRGYAFAGWGLKDETSGRIMIVYPDRYSALNLAEEGRITLYAQWEPVRYEVMIWMVSPEEDFTERGTVTITPDEATYRERVVLTSSPAPHFRLGTLLGMTTDLDFFNLDPDENGSCSFTMPDADVFFIGYFEGSPYTVVFDANGGAGKMDPQEHVYGDEENLSANAFTREHYRFLWWNTKADGTGVPYSDLHRVRNLVEEGEEEITLYAQWEPIEYTIIFMDGETELGRVTGAYGSAVEALADPEKKGSVFAGWSQKVPKTMPETPEEGLIIRALWDREPAPITPAPIEPPVTPAPLPDIPVTPAPKPTTTPSKSSGSSSAKKDASLAVAISRIDEFVTDSLDRDTQTIQRLRDLYGENYVLLLACFDPVQAAAALAVDPEMSGNALLAEALEEAGFDALVPDTESFDGDWFTACLELAGGEVPVLAANVYYDGTDDEHKAGENVFTPYVIRSVTVNGSAHSVAVLGLMCRGESSMPADGFLFAHPDNETGSLAEEVSLYLPKMEEDGAEMVIVCCFGDTAAPADKAEAGKWTHPAKILAQEGEGIDLLVTSVEGEQRPGKVTLKDRKGSEVTVLFADNGLKGGIYRLTEGKDGKLQYRLLYGGIQ